MGKKERTIIDFGEQWQAFQKNTGHYASQDIFKDILGPLVNIDDIRGKCVADIGSGTGRVVNMLVEAGAEQIVAVEPSSCFEILKKNTATYKHKINYQNISGDELNYEEKFDFVFSLGVLHHIPNPDPCIKACLRSLNKGGRMVIWLYGFEGNEFYLLCFHSIHRITRLLPHWALMGLCRLLLFPTVGYGKLAQLFNLPMHEYFLNHFLLLDRGIQLVTLYDQLNPTYSKYYRKNEAIQLLVKNGFKNVHIYNRHGYSWTVVGTKQ